MIRLARSLVLALALLFAVGQAAAFAAPCTLKTTANAAAAEAACPHHAPVIGESMPADADHHAPETAGACICLAAMTGLPALARSDGASSPDLAEPPAPPLLSVGWRAPPDPPRPKPL